LGTVKVQGQIAERDGDVILLGSQYTLQAGDRLVAGVETYGQA
jgi:hypothetical protein